AAYIRGIIALHRRLGLIGRMVLLGARLKPAWAVGAATLSPAKILENMEIGHNVLHGQWDWMNDPVINSPAWDWDTASTSQSWKHSQNYTPTPPRKTPARTRTRATRSCGSTRIRSGPRSTFPSRSTTCC